MFQYQYHLKLLVCNNKNSVKSLELLQGLNLKYLVLFKLEHLFTAYNTAKMNFLWEMYKLKEISLFHDLFIFTSEQLVYSRGRAIIDSSGFLQQCASLYLIHKRVMADCGVRHSAHSNPLTYSVGSIDHGLLRVPARVTW